MTADTRAHQELINRLSRIEGQVRAASWRQIRKAGGRTRFLECRPSGLCVPSRRLDRSGGSPDPFN